MRSENTVDSGPGDSPGDGPGTVIAGRYRLRRQLGRGGMGVVWEALDTRLNRPVAVKGLLYPGAADPGAQATWVSRARREAQAIARIRHQSVVDVHDVIEDGSQVWIVMELLDSRSLADLLREQRRLPVPQAAGIGLQVLRGLAAVHESGVLHRDVKPHNILFRPDGLALLMDFGIATFEGAAQVTRSHEIIGTPQYLAPELLSHTPADPRPASTASDLWALGVTLYEMVEGRRPFEGTTAYEVLIAVRERPVPPMEYAGPLTALIEALLSKDPGGRPDAAEAERMLREATRTVTAPAAPPREPEASLRPESRQPGNPGGTGGEGTGRRRRRWRVTAAVVCAALLTSAAWFLWTDRKDASDAAGSGKGAVAPERDGGPRFGDTHDVLRVGVKKDQPGLSERDGDTYRGFEVDLAYEIAREMGFEKDAVEFYEVNSDNRDDALKTGRVHLVLATYSIDEQREKRDGVRFAGPYFEALKGLLVREDRKYNDLSDLQNDRTAEVCTARESVYVPWIEKEGLADRTALRAGYEDCVKALLDPETDVYAVATDDVIVAGLADKYDAQTKALESLGGSEGYGVAVDGEERELRQEVCEALSAVMAKSPGQSSRWSAVYTRHLQPIMDRPAPEEPDLTSC
ncbi:protein kinase [Streptomyces sp. ISL-12]|uniref:serine/threonine-protein kinase n=1 Tax=Streptomyces sp. ISL-12 TaxID=2819177 RepID=UPI001BEBACE3|nr:serine/threonine-protein kinase [Streptomyces sp. ISL-12]MBT2414659.1 protein kinase [Streptomyces sp. ISL-12]